MESARIWGCFVIHAFLFHGLIPLPAQASGLERSRIYVRDTSRDNLASASPPSQAEGVTVFACMRWCLEHDWCRAVLFKREGGACELTQTTDHPPGALISAPGYAYYYWKRECPESLGYLFYPNFDLCIRMVNSTADQVEALQACAADGPEARLLEFDTDDKVNRFTELVEAEESVRNGMPDPMRVAGGREAGTNNFLLTGGQPIASSLPYAMDEPNDLNEMCLAVSYELHGALMRHDCPCASMNFPEGFICEYVWQ